MSTFCNMKKTPKNQGAEKEAKKKCEKVKGHCILLGDNMVGQVLSSVAKRKRERKGIYFINIGGLVCFLNL